MLVQRGCPWKLAIGQLIGSSLVITKQSKENGNLVNSGDSNIGDITRQQDRPWTMSSWQRFEARQQPTYPDPQHYDRVLKVLNGYPPLVFSGEVDRLKSQLISASRGESFVLQGGDCAERFQDCRPEVITSKLNILLQMSMILCYGARRPVVRIGRIAGQYSKPRSSLTEKVGARELPVFRGDSINGFEASEAARTPDPERLLTAYHCASMTLNYIRAMINGGFANLNHPENWDLGFFAKSSQKERYEAVVGGIKDAVAFMESFGGVREHSLDLIDFFTSHEGLHLGFEQSLTRLVPPGEQHYNLGAHMLWVGDRTRNLSGAHIEYLRGIANPIGIKWGPTAVLEEMLATIERLNPTNEPGRVVLISRFGHQQIVDYLPMAIEAVQKRGLDVLWTCDPMHGNLRKTSSGVKTRSFADILDELQKAFSCHEAAGSWLGGVHFELTGDDVTECTGGATGLGDSDLSRQYETFCDPRLNYSQSLEMAFAIASLLRALKP